MKKKVIRVGLHKLQEFVKNHPCPIVFFYEFDLDENNAINKVEFSKMLMATDIKEFASKDIRKIVVDHIFAAFKKNEIEIKLLAAFFKIPFQTYPEAKINDNSSSNNNVHHRVPRAPVSLNYDSFDNVQYSPAKHIGGKNQSLDVPKTPDPIHHNNAFGKK
jgi:hypothetical protein